MRSGRVSSVFGIVSFAFLVACSSDDAGPKAGGNVTLDNVTSKHASGVLRFSARVHNTTQKNMKALETIELDVGSGAKRATSIQTCEGADISPWLAKAGATNAVDFTVRSNGPERMVVESFCFEGATQSSRSALWEFQTFAKIETDGADPVKIAMNGTLDDGSLWTATATSTRE